VKPKTLSYLAAFTIIVSYFPFVLAETTDPARGWLQLTNGMEYRQFNACSVSPYDDSKITIVRVNPEKVSLQLLASSELNENAMLAEEWAEKYDLSLVINAGMFAEDWETHLGYFKTGTKTKNIGTTMKDYKSVLAFNPNRKGIPSASMFDLDVVSLPIILDKYHSVMQNIRMIKFPGKVVWGKTDRKWSEAAIGMDQQHRVLFIFSRSPYPMDEFSRCLLQLRIGIVSAQHLEGGGDASMVIRTPKLNRVFVGSYETNANDGIKTPYINIQKGYRLPNIIGISANP